MRELSHKRRPKARRESLWILVTLETGEQFEGLIENDLLRIEPGQPLAVQHLRRGQGIAPEPVAVDPKSAKSIVVLGRIGAEKPRAQKAAALLED